jgi:hypothetical protein
VPRSNRPHTRTAASTAAVGVALLLGACAQQDNPELQWARAALERNPQVKVLEVDAPNNAIKVRIVATGETVSVTPGELAAIPISDLVTLAQQAKAPPPAAEPVAAVAPEPPPAPPEAMPAAEPEAPKAAPNYTVEREDGRVRVSGPGVSIETAAKPTPAAEATPVRTDEPIVCDGKTMLHLDGRMINAAGDAITARGGCELHITNSRISAGGTALTVLDATVHISNSELQGDDGSLTASSAARIFIRNTRFTGLARRDPKASIRDQGGTTWR